MGKSTISMVMFNSYVTNYQRVSITKYTQFFAVGILHEILKNHLYDSTTGQTGFTDPIWLVVDIGLIVVNHWLIMAGWCC